MNARNYVFTPFVLLITIHGYTFVFKGVYVKVMPKFLFA